MYKLSKNLVDNRGTNETYDSDGASLTPTPVRSERISASKHHYTIFHSRHDAKSLRGFAQKLHKLLKFKGVKNKTELLRLSKPELAEALREALQSEMSGENGAKHPKKNSINELCKEFWESRSRLDQQLEKLSLGQLQGLADNIDKKSRSKIVLEATDDKELRREINELYEDLEKKEEYRLITSIDRFTEEMLTQPKARSSPVGQSTSTRNRTSQRLGKLKQGDSLEKAIEKIENGLMEIKIYSSSKS